MFGLARFTRRHLTLLAERISAQCSVAGAIGDPLSGYSDDEIDAALRAFGKSRAHLFTVAPGNAPHRQRMAQVMARFGVAPGFAVCRCWSALRRADQACAACANKRRCMSWLDWPVARDAPRVFCPNADTFDAIARQQRTQQAPAGGP